MRSIFAESAFTAHVGLERRPASPGMGHVHLGDGDHLDNHVGSRHAGALFATGDAAGAALVTSTFPPAVVPLLSAHSASIAYERMAKGPVTATARLAGGLLDVELVNYVSSGRMTSFEVDVDMTDENGRTVARMTLEYRAEPGAGGSLSHSANGNGRKGSH